MLIADGARTVAAVHVLHHQEVLAASFVGIVGSDDIGMLQLGGSPHFTLEAFNGSRVVVDVGRQHLQGDQALHASMLGLKDLAHAAGANPVKDYVLPEHKRLGAPLLNGVCLVGCKSLLLNE